MKILEDRDPMPFGKHRGLAMEDVPASYMFWLWTEGDVEHEETPVSQYIRRNLSAYEMEYPDGVS
jgi:uncharacterized protein (DUF3820 family)